MSEMMRQLLWHSLAMSAIVLVYHAATAGLSKRYAAKWFYLAGVILLIGFLIPFRPVITVEMKRMPVFLQDAAGQGGAFSALPAAAPRAMTENTQGFPWHIVCVVWAVGALATLAYHGIKHVRFVTLVKRWRTDVTDARLLSQFEKAKRSLQLQDHDIGLAHCACIRCPMLIYLDRPTVVLPEGGCDPKDRHLIMLHELIHYQRRDLLCRLAMLLATAIHWFNPAIYLLVKLVATQCEVSCDERVVRGQDIDGRHQYAMSLIGMAQSHPKGYTLLTTYFNGGKSTMKKRINSVYEPAKTRAGVLLLACMLLTTLLAGTSIAADAGEINYTLPATALQINEKVDAYTVSWEPMAGIKEYHLGVYFHFQIEETDLVNPDTGDVTENVTEFMAVGKGWIGAGEVTDNDGVAHTVEYGVWEALTLPGDATEADIGELINTQLDLLSDDQLVPEALLGCNLIIVAVRESGAPIQVDISLLGK